jgi:hypothetical protein
MTDTPEAQRLRDEVLALKSSTASRIAAPM